MAELIGNKKSSARLVLSQQCNVDEADGVDAKQSGLFVGPNELLLFERSAVRVVAALVLGDVDIIGNPVGFTYI